MARNSSGTHSLPAASNPVTTGTTITSTWANTTMSDLSAEITDSLSRSGKGPMQAPLEATDGTAAAPSITFDSDVDTGLYRVGANEGGVSAGGTRKAGWSATGWLADVIQTIAAGALTLKSTVADGASAVAHVLDTTVALANATAKLASFRNNGTEKLAVDKDGFLRGAAADGASAVGLAVGSNATFSTTGAKILSVRNNTTEKVYVDKDGAIYAAATESTTGFVMGTNWTDSGVYVNRTAGLVSLNFLVTATAGAPSWTSLLTLPAGYRPAQAFYFFGRVFDSSAGSSFYARFRVATSGVLSAQDYDDGSISTSMFAAGASDTGMGYVTFNAV